MEKNITKESDTILCFFSTVAELSKCSKLPCSLLELLDEPLAKLAVYFGSTKLQALIIAAVYTHNYSKGTNADVRDLSLFFDCSPLKILQWTNDFEVLEKMNILQKELETTITGLPMTDVAFYINPVVSQAIINNAPLPDLNNEEPEAGLELVDVLLKMYNVGQLLFDEKIKSNNFDYKIRRILEQYKNIPLLSYLAVWDCDIYDKYFFCYSCWKFFNGAESVDVEAGAKGMFDRPTRRLSFIKSIVHQNNYLCKNNWIEHDVVSRFFDGIWVKLTDKSLDILLGDEKEMFYYAQNRKDIIKPADIKEKTLFYNQCEKKQMSDLSNILQNDQLENLQKRLTEKGLPKGIAVLFYGLPGTGKTETVYQIAHRTKREIIHVDISQTKSMWFGESEKRIKKVFSDYKARLKSAAVCPILLFNEADAVISRRMIIGNSSVDQTENAIQNIILEELEKFEGILFATTNLVSNFDAAFERRFLFKVEYHKPDKTNRAKIWQSKIACLSMDDALQLSEKFDFSGGQIDNIARKYEIAEIIENNKPELEQLISFCNDETLVKAGGIKIGYQK